jgi:hypothetical protein
MHATCFAHLILLDLIIQIIWPKGCDSQFFFCSFSNFHYGVVPLICFSLFLFLSKLNNLKRTSLVILYTTLCSIRCPLWFVVRLRSETTNFH